MEYREGIQNYKYCDLGAIINIGRVGRMVKQGKVLDWRGRENYKDR